MTKKFLKGLYCVALMLVTLGALCFIPAIKSNAKVASADEVGSQVATTSGTGEWTDAYAASATAPTYTTVTRPDGEFKVIDSTDKLAYVAYMVTIQEDADWAKTNFELTADLDLSASLWTPIGTSANPYQGIFHGNRHQISGLRVSESSAAKASVAGLFGYTKGEGAEYAQITDLVLGSFTYIANGNPTLRAGTLVGNAGQNTIIANVYDEREYKGDIATIGAVADSTVYVYRGGSPDGATAKYTTKDKIDATVTIDKFSPALPTSGYAITYVQTSKSGTTGFSAANTGFYKCTSTTSYDETLKYPVYGTVITDTGAAGVEYGNYGSLLTTRASAMADGSGYFAVNKNKTLGKGYTFSLSTPSISSSSMTTLYNRGLIETMTWEESSFSVKVNYGYGHNTDAGKTTPRTMTLTVGNDYSWEEAIPTSRYTNTPVDTNFTTYRRIGFNFAGRFYESAFTNEVTGYVGDNKGLSAGEYSMYLKWTPKTDIAYSVDFSNASSDTGFDPKDAVRKFDIKEDGVSVLSSDDAAAADRVDFDLTNHTADKAVTVEFVLNAGYKFPTSGSSNTITSSRADIENCGAYLLFAEGGYDKYNEPEYSISTETRATGEAGANETWIIVSINNIVAGDGAVTLAFERQEYTIDLSDSEGVTYTLSDVTNAKGESTDTYTVLNDKVITTRWGENFKLTATAEDNKYIIAYAAQDFPINAGTITGEGTYNETYKKNFKTYTYTISSYANILTAGKTSHKITITAIELKVNVDISIVHNATDEYKAIAENTAAGRKDASGSETLTTGDTPVTFVANIVDGLVEVYMYSNAYYTNDDGAFVVKRLIGDDYTTIDSLQPEPELVTEGAYKGYYRYIYRFEGIIEDNKGVPSYQVQFTAVPQTYTVEYAVEVSFDGGATYVTLNASNEDHAKLLARWFTSRPTTTPSGKYGDSVNFAYVLTENFGATELLQQDYVISRKNAEETVGEVGTLNEGKTAYIYGTANSVVTARFILKNPKLTLLSEGYVLDVNGQNRKVTYTDAGIKFADGESVRFTETGITRTATVNEAGNVPMDVNSNVVTIDIPTGYYFVGWYLKNGEVYTELTSGADISLNQLLTNTVLVNALKSSTTAVTNFEIVPAIKQKTVTLKFSKGENALEDYVTSGATSAGEYTYYHEQENARFNQFEGDNTNARAAFEFSTMNNKVHKVGSVQKGWVADYESATHEYLIDGTFTSQVFESDVWAAATNFDIEFVPTWNLLQYTVKIDNSVEVNIYMGDTVTVAPGEIGTEAEGAATYTVTRPNGDILSSASIAPEKGMHVTGFTFGGGTGTRTGEVTTFTLTEENIKTYLETGFFYTSGQAFTIETEKDPNVYRLVLTANRQGETFVSGFESDENTKYVEVTYGTQPTALAGITVERAGYRLASWVDATNTSNVLATVDAQGRYTYTGNYLTNSDTTVKAMWTPVEGGEYIQIATTGNNTVDYIGIAQQVATSTVSTLGGDVDLTAVLPNGDRITDQYWAKADKVDGAYVKVSTTNALNLTTVAESGNYVYVVEFRDTFETNVSYTIESAPVTITINRNALVVNGWQLDSYYTGDSSFLAVEATNKYGDIQFANGLTDDNRTAALAALAEKVAFNKVVIQDTTGKYNVGSYTTVRYYITLTEEEYANLDTTVVRKETVGEGEAATTLYYIELTAEASANKIQIKATPVTINVSGKGFFMGANINHSVKAEFVAGLETVPVDNFVFSATVMTNSGAAGVYNNTAQFTWPDLKITRGGETVANSNFEFTVAGEYEIEEITTSNAYVFNYSVGYLTAGTDNQLASVANTYQGGSAEYRVRVTSISVDGTVIASFNSNATFFNYVDETTGNAIFTISGNGSTAFMLAVRQGSNVEFTVAVEERTVGANLIFLGFQTNQADIAAYADAFDNAPVADKTATVRATASADFYALYTDLKQVTVNYNANSSMTSETLYLTAGVAKNIADPEWKGFAFNAWTTTSEQIGIVDATTGTNVTANAGAYAKAAINANWTLEEPAVTQNKTTITGNAIDTTVTSGTITISVSDIISEITNENRDDIQYSFEWSGEKISTTTTTRDGSITLTNPTLASNGNYTLKVIATAGSTTKTTSVNFTVALTESTIALNGATTDLTYNAANRNAEIMINYSINGVAQTSTIKLSDYYDNGNVPAGKHLGFVIKYKANESAVESTVTEIKNAGIYTIGLVVDGNVYADSTSTVTVVVKAIEYKITEADNISYSKAFGSKDPSMVKEITVPGAGKVTVTFGREEGEVAGESYALNIKSVSDDQNYIITIDETNKWFSIDELKSDLYVELANKLTRVYDGTTATQVTVELAGNVWTLYVKAADGTTLAESVVNIYYLNPTTATLTPVAGDDIALAFNDVDFALSSNARNRGVYTITATAGTKGSGDTDFRYDGIQFTGENAAEYEITVKEITIENVTKEFDTTRTFTNANVTVKAGDIVTGDTVTVSGSYASEKVNDSIAITFDALAGADAGNYVISNASVNTGAITVSDNTITVNQADDKKAFTYGSSITSATTVAQLIDTLGLSLSVDGHADGASYVSITGFAIVDAAYGASENLNAKTGAYTITLTLTSTEYSDLNGKTATVTINVKDLSVDSSTVVTKPYDGTTTLPVNIDWKLAGVVEGDDVAVDDTSAAYAKATIDTDIAINGLTTKGDDKANYNFNSAVTGEIGSVELKFNVKQPSFVNDGVTNPTDKTFNATYNGVAADLLAAIAGEMVTRTGYVQTGFTFGANLAVDETNFTAFLDAAVKAKNSGLELNAVWTKKTHTVSFNATNASVEVYTVAEDGTETLATGTSFEYFTKFKVKVTGDSGYKFTDARVTAGSAELAITGAGKRTGGELTFTLNDEDTIVRVDTANIKVTVKVVTNIPQYTAYVSGDTADAELNFTDAAVQTATAKAGLDARAITVTAHTYNLVGWTYSKDGEATDLGNETLKALLGELDDDATITFTAKWDGIEYTVKFDPTDGTITSGDAQVQVKFGETISAFPTAEFTGKVNTWNTEKDRSGTRYIVGETPLKDIREDEILTLYACWIESDFELEVEFTDSNINSVVVDGQPISSGDTIKIKFPESKTFTVTSAPGYGFTAALADASHGAVTKTGNTITVERLAFNSKLTISATANENTLTVASVNAEDNSTEGKVKAFTATTAQVVFTANAGYTFVEGDLRVAFSGSGNVESQVISNNGKTLTITWAGFTGDANLTVTATAVNNVVTVADCSDKVASIAINGSYIQAVGGSYAQATTGTTLTVVVTLKYGYTGADLVLTNGNTELSKSGPIEKFENGIYSYEFTITGFTQNFDLDVTASERTYSVNVTTEKPDEDTAGAMTATVDKTENVKFGVDEITFTATVSNITYLFEGWYIGGTRVSTDEEYKLILTDTELLREELERNSNTLNVVAKFSYSISDVDINLTGRGGEAGYEYTKDGTTSNGTIGANSKAVVNLNMESTLKITLEVAEGYLVESVEFIDVTGASITGKDWFNSDDNTITIDFNVDSVPLKTINVKFVAGPASVHVVTGVEINHVVNAPNSLGGKVSLADENGQVNASYTSTEYTVPSKTGETIYFLVEKNDGYVFTFRPGENTSVTIDRIKPEEFTGNRMLYRVSGYAGNIDLNAVFTASDNTINIYFKNGNNKVAAGEIVVKEGNNIVVSGNNSSDVRVSALTNATFEVTLYANFSYSFGRDENGLKYTPVGGLTVAPGTITSSLNAERGYTESVTITISGVTQDSNVEIEVLPKEYKINFVSGGVSQGTISGVYYDQAFTIQGNIVPEAKDGFTFNGYFTKQLGQGKQYVTAQGLPAGPWKETGYIWDGTRYIVQEGYNGKDTFDIYASYTFDKQKMYLDIIPDALKDTIKSDSAKISIADLVVSLATQPSWSSVDDLLYAEVLADAEITLYPYAFEGYTFHHWEFYRVLDDNSLELISSTTPTPVPTTHTYPTSSGTIRIKAVYFANYEITINNYRTNQLDGDCGEAYLEQNSQACDGSYDTREHVTLVAKEGLGYKFYGWYDVKNSCYLSDANGMIKGTFDNGVWTYTFDEYLTEPLTLRADYEGIEIDVIVNIDAFRAHGTLRNVRVNGTPVSNFASGRAFKARIGDILTIELTPDHGYGVKFGTLAFSGQEGIYTYKIAGKDMDAATQTLTVAIEADPQPINYTFDIQVEEQSNSDELALAGSLSYRDTNGTVITIDRNTRITTLYGSTIYIDVNALANYKIGSVKLQVNGITYDITNTYVDNQKQIILSSDILAQYNAGSDARIIVSFSRMLWTDYRSEGLAGDGTEKNPYKITSAEDMAFVAYAVNNNLPGEDGRVAYRDASYIVTKDLDFSGKYWVPIGTSSVPFNGVIDFGSHWFKGIVHYTTYDPSTTTEGLIWYKTARAQIIRAESNVLLIALCSAGGALLLIALIILIIFLVRRSKKKKMEELANS